MPALANLSFTLLLSIISTLVTGIFAALVLKRWSALRRPHLLAWGIGLTMYFVGTLSQVVLYFVWSPLFFSLWYWCGALMVAAWLGQGTVFLLVRRGSIARNIQMALILVGAMTFPWVLFLTPLNASAWEQGQDITTIYQDIKDPVTGDVTRPGILEGSWRGTVRFFSPVMNTWGTIALVGGALWSARLFRRKQILRNRMLGNWFIAAGGLLPAFGGALIRLGDPSFKYAGEMLGAILIFMGFLLATGGKDDAATASARAAPPQETAAPEGAAV